MSLTYVILKVCKTETDSPIQKTNVCYQGEREGGEDKLGQGLTILTAIYKIDKQQDILYSTCITAIVS